MVVFKQARELEANADDNAALVAVPLRQNSLVSKELDGKMRGRCHTAAVTSTMLTYLPHMRYPVRWAGTATGF